MTGFFQRGGVWVLAQSLLMAAVILLAARFQSGTYQSWMVISGFVLLGISAVVCAAGALAIGRNLSPLPHPGARARLVRTGAYAVVRHPLYSGVMAAAFGWALVWQSWPALLAAAALIPFFRAKASREERWLRERFPEYAAYEKQVHRFIPWR